MDVIAGQIGPDAEGIGGILHDFLKIHDAIKRLGFANPFVDGLPRCDFPACLWRNSGSAAACAMKTLIPLAWAAAMMSW